MKGKRLVSMLLVLILVLGVLPSDAWATRIIASGGLGSGIGWNLDSDGELAITGTGLMINYDHRNDAPWHEFKGQITSVVIGYGVTSIGNWVFSDCSALTSVTIPKSVERIGNYAFLGCSS